MDIMKHVHVVPDKPPQKAKLYLFLQLSKAEQAENAHDIPVRKLKNSLKINSCALNKYLS